MFIPCCTGKTGKTFVRTNITFDTLMINDALKLSCNPSRYAVCLHANVLKSVEEHGKYSILSSNDLAHSITLTHVTANVATAIW